MVRPADVDNRTASVHFSESSSTTELVPVSNIGMIMPTKIPISCINVILTVIFKY